MSEFASDRVVIEVSDLCWEVKNGRLFVEAQTVTVESYED